jgi:hypothetical protein
MRLLPSADVAAGVLRQKRCAGLVFLIPEARSFAPICCADIVRLGTDVPAQMIPVCLVFAINR